MKRLLTTLLALAGLAKYAAAQGTIQLVSTYECRIPATALAPESDELDSVVTSYQTGLIKGKTDTAATVYLRYERETGRLLEKQVRLTANYQESIGYAGTDRPYHYQYRYDPDGRLSYFSDAVTGRYQLLEYTDKNVIVKTFDAASRRLLDQAVKPAGKDLAQLPHIAR